MKKKMTAYDLTIGAMFVALMAIGANITAWAPFLSVGGVPLTLQTFIAILAGVVLGSRLGAFSLLVYMLLGLVGAPIFAQFGGGPSMIVAPTFGFIVSYIMLAYVAGKLVEMKRSLPMYITAALVGLAINYLVGTNWMYFAYQLWLDIPEQFSYGIVWGWMALFLVKDLVLAVVAGLFAHRLEKSVLHRTPLRKSQEAA
ncbi:biotin transporter BioY [Thalassobacillus hwangdonensis]|uniref:Biotin transporter n=1 Tax=Thalassobacillus hwangdonensis TaxID=546108 RepID=A0ABW3L1U0_9BACI